MRILQVKNVPEDIYEQLHYLAHKEHRSLAQEVIMLIQEGIESRLGNKERRLKLLEKKNPLSIQDPNLPEPVALVREDRNR